MTGRQPSSAAPVGDAATVTVAGVGRSVVVPDALRVELAVEAREPSVVTALDLARATMAQVRRLVTAAGVPAADQRTTGLTIHPAYDDRSGTPNGYVATESLTVLLRAPDLVDAVLGAATEAAGDLLRIGGVGFTVTDPSSAEDDARRAALGEARRRAELYAAELGASVGALVRLTEGGGWGHDSGAFRMEMAHGGSLEPGTQLVEIQVIAEWTVRTSDRA